MTLYCILNQCMFIIDLEPRHLKKKTLKNWSRDCFFHPRAFLTPRSRSEAQLGFEPLQLAFGPTNCHSYNQQRQCKKKKKKDGSYQKTQLHKWKSTTSHLGSFPRYNWDHVSTVPSQYQVSVCMQPQAGCVTGSLGVSRKATSPGIESKQAPNGRDPVTPPLADISIPSPPPQTASRSSIRTAYLPDNTFPNSHRGHKMLTGELCVDSNSNNKINVNNNNNICPKGTYTQRACFFSVSTKKSTEWYYIQPTINTVIIYLTAGGDACGVWFVGLCFPS